MSGQRRGFGGHAFHQVAVGDDGVDVIIEELGIGAVESGGEVFGADGHSDAVREALSERACRRFD
jgi:hypothetical protein